MTGGIHGLHQPAGRGPAGHGLPFAGIPPELGRDVERILASEPAPEEIETDFNYQQSDRRPLSLAAILAPKRAALALALLLVLLESFTVQLGPLLARYGIDRGVVPGDMSALLAVCGLYIASLVANGFIGYARVAWNGRLAEDLVRSLRVRVFTHIQRLSIDRFTEEMSGRLISRMTSDIDAFGSLLQEGFIELLVQTVTLVLVTGFLFLLDPKLAAFTILLVAPLMLILTLWFSRRSERGYAAVRERIADVLADFQENLTGIHVVRAFNRERRNVSQHIDRLGQYRSANLHTVRLAATFDSGSNLIALSGQALIVFVGGRMMLAGELTVGELTAFLLYLASFYGPIQHLVQLYNIYQRGQAALLKLRELLDTEPSVREAPDARELPSIEGSVELRGVSFGYGAGKSAVEGLDLVIRPGETVALVGQTGAGKSTVARLMTRLYDPTQGAVLIDGTDLREVKLQSLRRQFGLVPQEPFLFAGTIRDNLAFARPDASDAEVVQACQAVGIGDLIEQKPGGIHFPIHERGSSLSSGERQLLALARAFLARPRIIILDEATSNLDLASEARIQRALQVLLQSRTAVIIAHRLSTAMKADRIAVLEQGRLVELGTHAELVARKGTYSEMFAVWSSYSLDTVG